MSDNPHVLVLIESSRQSGREYIRGIAEYAHHFGPWHFHWATQDLAALKRPLKKKHFDGIIARDVALIKHAVSPGTPMIVLRYTTMGNDDMLFVGTDDMTISRTVVDHFIRRGFKNFAFCGVRGCDWSVKRKYHFKKCLNESRFALQEFEFLCLQYRSGFNSRETARIKKWLLQLPRPVAVMAANDDTGLLFVQFCREVGLRVPEDCAVVGVDNDPIVCGLSDPPLSSIELKFHEAGYRAASVLDLMMRGERSDRMKINSMVGNLVVRQSSDIVAVDDPSVVAALRFIQNNSFRSLNVDEIVRVSGVSRRALETRFRYYLAKTIKGIYREIRGDHIARVLSQTVMSIDEVAEQCGFEETSHFIRFFKSVKGATPAAFRKRH
ncbi:MAG: DNA-binding transcriptional regulator [Kiritimatiellia bacterium]